jgi:hypothetical protein
MPTRLELLRELSFGHRIAEDEAKNLAKYFVETEQWRTIFSGKADIVYGAKGAGKSAIYALLKDKETELSKRNIILTSAEEPRGDTVFSDLVNDPPTSESEFVNLWKLYLLSLVGRILQDYAPDDSDAIEVITALEKADLVGKTGGLRALLRSVSDYVRRIPDALQLSLTLDPLTSMPSGVSGKIIFKDPTNAESKQGLVGVDQLFTKADISLSKLPGAVWILLDRLDVAFADSEELEANALRALFKVYRSLATRENIRLKIFLRTDIWSRITKDQGFREASHFTQTTTITWNKPSLINLIIRRAIQSPTLLDHCNVTYDEALTDKQDIVLSAIFPDQVDIGPNKSKTLDWIFSRTRDGSSQNAPRELIHFLEASREAEIKKIELGEPEEVGVLLSRPAIREALPIVSSARLHGTLYPEYPDLRKYVDALNREKSLQYLATLAQLWHLDLDATGKVADELADIGFFEKGGSKEEPEYKVPFLYRSALGITQGTAEERGSGSVE